MGDSDLYSFGAVKHLTTLKNHYATGVDALDQTLGLLEGQETIGNDDPSLRVQNGDQGVGVSLAQLEPFA